MCVRDECTIIKRDGSTAVEETIRYCEKADRRNKKMCSRIKKTKTVYNTRAPSTISRDDASSPASNGPFTPPTAGSAGYRTETRRPSVTRRPSTTERAIKPEIVISIGSKKYPRLSLSAAKSPKRTSYGSINSNEAALESPTSDQIRTGFPEANISPPASTFSHPQGYTTRDAVPQDRIHPSASYYTAPSQVPSLTSELEAPSRPRPSRNLPALVHQSTAPASSTVSHVPTLSASYTTSSSRSNYHTTTVVPQQSSRTNVGSDGVTALGYGDFISPPPSSTGSSARSGRSAAPEVVDRANLQRRDSKRRQEEDGRKNDKLSKEEEEKKQVRFVLGRAEDREKQRAELKYAQSEMDRAKAREEIREQKKRDREPEKKATRKPEREKTKPPTKEFNLPRNSNTSRRNSMTQSEMEYRDLLLREDRAQMSRERENVERLEREEQLVHDYYNPRTSNTTTTSTLGRRPSVSRRGSVSSTAPRGVSIVQPAPPNPYATRPPSSSSHNPPPLSYPYPANTSATRPPSSHRTPTYAEYENPFAAPSTRPIHPTYTAIAPPDPHNPFNPQSPILHQPREHDPWDTRQMHANLPTVQPGSGFSRNALHAQGEQVINRSGDRGVGVGHSAHGRARQATGRMEQALYTSGEESSGSSGGLYEQDVGVRGTGTRRHKGLGEGKGKRRV